MLSYPLSVTVEFLQTVTEEVVLLNTLCHIGCHHGLSSVSRYYYCLGVRQLGDVFDLAAAHVDGVKFAGGSFMVMPEQSVRDITDLCHKHQVSSGATPVLSQLPAVLCWAPVATRQGLSLKAQHEHHTLQLRLAGAWDQIQ